MHAGDVDTYTERQERVSIRLFEWYSIFCLISQTTSITAGNIPPSPSSASEPSSVSPCSRQVYWGNGCQIIPPHDAGIAAAIEQNLELWELPAELPPALVYDPTQQIAASYYSKLTAHLHMRSAEANAAAARAVYTPLHGVGGKFVLRAFKVTRGVEWGFVWHATGSVGA